MVPRKASVSVTPRRSRRLGASVTTSGTARDNLLCGQGLALGRTYPVFFWLLFLFFVLLVWAYGVEVVPRDTYQDVYIAIGRVSRRVVGTGRGRSDKDDDVI